MLEIRLVVILVLMLGACKNEQIVSPNEQVISQDGTPSQLNNLDNLVRKQQVEVELVEVETGALDPLKVWDFAKYGRPENMYVLRYARDLETCSILTHSLNKPTAPKTTADYDAPAYAFWQNTLMGSELNLPWMRQKNIPYPFMEVDLDNDSYDDYLYRSTTHYSGWSKQSLYKSPYNSQDVFVNEKFDYNRMQGQSAGLYGLHLYVHSKRGVKIDWDDRSPIINHFFEITQINSINYVLNGIFMVNSVPIEGRQPQIINLFKMDTSKQFQLMCRLWPKYKHY